jgi:hypothetical protein
MDIIYRYDPFAPIKPQKIPDAEAALKSLIFSFSDEDLLREQLGARRLRFTARNAVDWPKPGPLDAVLCGYSAER